MPLSATLLPGKKNGFALNVRLDGRRAKFMPLSATLLPGKKNGFALNVRLDGPPRAFWTVRRTQNIVPAQGFKLQTVHLAPWSLYRLSWSASTFHIPCG